MVSSAARRVPKLDCCNPGGNRRYDKGKRRNKRRRKRMLRRSDRVMNEVQAQKMIMKESLNKVE